MVGTVDLQPHLEVQQLPYVYVGHACEPQTEALQLSGDWQCATTVRSTHSLLLRPLLLPEIFEPAVLKLLTLFDLDEMYRCPSLLVVSGTAGYLSVCAVMTLDELLLRL